MGDWTGYAMKNPAGKEPRQTAHASPEKMTRFINNQNLGQTEQEG